MKIRTALLLSCLTGFVSISMEIIWFSVVGFLFKGHAGVFGMVLSLILLGIAIGAKYVYKRIKNYDKEQTIKLISNALLLCGIINFTGLPFTAFLMTFHIAFATLIFINIIAVSAMLGCIFPLLCHITVSSSETKVGRQTSWIYAANIIGATSGPLLTGYVLIDLFPIQVIITIFCVIPVLAALFLNLPHINKAINRKYVVSSFFLVVIVLTACQFFYSSFFEKIHFNEAFIKNKKFKYLVENRNGIIAVDQTSEGDVFYSGGTYDGAVNTDLLNPVNKISRAYMIAAMHPAPKRVLMIGLSTGSWAKVLADFSRIEELVIAEINPGYLQLVKKYPEVADVLQNKKVKIIIDDGRRWLKLNANEKFDFIVMNTSFHWREHITNLLSKEFLQLCKTHLNEGGVMYWNTTHSPVVVNTACHVFNNVATYLSFVAASDSPFIMTAEERKNAFLSFIRNGKPVFQQNDSTLALLDKYCQTSLANVKDSFLKKKLLIITDDNMATEYKARVYR